MTAKKLLPIAWGRSLTAVVAVAVSALLASCAYLNPPIPEPKPEPVVVEKKPPPEPIKPPPASRLYEWNGSKDYISRIEISINEQKARFYSGEKEVGWTTVASGVFRNPTPVGSFAILEKVQNKRSNLYGKIYNRNGKLVKSNADLGVDVIPAGGRFVGASMPYFLRITNDGIGMHAGPIPRPGNRASHGCIRMPKKFAPILYRYVDVGTPVTIKGNGPNYASYLSKRRRSAPKATSPAPAQPESAVASTEAPASPAADTSPAVQPATGSDVAVVAPGAADLATQVVPAAAAEPPPGAVEVPVTAPAAEASPPAGTAEAAGVPTDSPAESNPAPASLQGDAAAAAAATTAESGPATSDGPSSVASGSEETSAEAAIPATPAEIRKPVSPSAEGTESQPAPPAGPAAEAERPTPSDATPRPTEAEAMQRSEG